MIKRLILLLLCAGLIACQPQQSPRQDIRLAVAQAPINLDPRYATDAASARVNRLIYRSLVSYDSASKVVPDLAVWQLVSPTQYRFKLGAVGRTFHDGSALNAEDVQATYLSLMTLKDSPLSAEFANIQQIKVLDADTVDFYLKQPDSAFPSKLIIGILPAKTIAAGADVGHHPIGSGPLKFENWQHVLKLKRLNDGAVISLLEVKDPTVRVLKLLRGEVDILQGDLPPELLKYLKIDNIY